MNAKVKTVQPDDSWADEALGVDPETVETFGPEYPYIQWVNGKVTLRQAGGVAWTGGWFAQAEQFDGELPGWQAGQLIHDDGSETAGWFARDVTVAVIHWRRRWLSGTNGQRVAYAWDAYDEALAHGKASGHLHALVLVRGLEDLGPLVLTMKGVCAAMFTGGRKAPGVLGEFNRQIIRPGNALNAKRGLKGADGKAPRWPYRAFWLTVGPERDDKGAPSFTVVGTPPNSKQVTLPVALGLPEHADLGALKERFVGAEMLKRLNELYQETSEWAHAWDAIEPAAVQVGEQPGDGTGPEYANAPEPTEEQIPF